MKLPLAHRPAPAASVRSGAFTLVEMMITVGLLGFIVLGLTAMFVQTQRAFRAGTAQTDVLESGRAVVELVARELEETSPAGIGYVTNFSMSFETFSTVSLPGGGGQSRTNVLSSVFALTRSNKKWTGIGYVVAAGLNRIDDVKAGTLYRWQYSNPAGNQDPALLAGMFSNTVRYAVNNFFTADYNPGTSARNISSNLVRVADGVVHLRLLAYDPAGGLISTNYDSGLRYQGNTNILFTTTFLYPGHLEVYNYTFTSNAVPASLDLELAVLEPEVWDKLKSQPNNNLALQYLARQVGRIHVFRRHVAVHQVDPEAYR